MKMIPVTKPYFSEEENQAVSEALASGWVAQGPRVTEFEKAVAEHEGVKEGVAVTSCTTALHLAMVVLGLKSGMDAIAPAFTFVATTNSIVATGATPILVDIDTTTFNLDIEKLEKLISTKYIEEKGQLINKESGNILWGIVPVHEFGLCCNMEAVNRISKKYNLKVVEDAACALGAKIGQQHEGNFGNMSCISFHPRKSITTGEGGMVLTDDVHFAKKMRELRSHGCSISADVRDKGKGFLLPEYTEAGYNYRMTDIQAAIGLIQIQKLDEIIEIKRKKAAIYNGLLAEYIEEFITPVEPNNYFHTYQSYVCMLDRDKIGIGSIKEGGQYRNELLERLEKRGIATRQGTHAIHLLGYYKEHFGYIPEDYPNAYAADHLSITLPLYVQMTDEEQKYVVEQIRQTLNEMKKGEK